MINRLLFTRFFMKQTLIFCLFTLLATVGTPFSVIACDIPSGLKAAPVGSSATLSWNAVAGAGSYRLEIENASDNSVFFKAEASASGTTYTVTGLTAGKNYKFKVRSVCSGDKGKWSEWTFFNASGTTTTGGGGTVTNGSCGVPVQLNAPVIAGKAQLSWGAVSGAVSYSIEIENASGSTAPFSFTTTVATNSCSPTQLASTGVYKYKVRANCANGKSDWSAWLVFHASTGATGSSTGGACSIPTGLNTTNTTIAGTALLHWNAVPGALSYRIEAEDASGNNVPWKATAAASTSPYTLTGLTAGRNYKFKVRAVCGSQQSDWADWAFFNAGGTTTTGNNGGNTGNLSCAVPIGLGVQPTANSAVFNWATANGATGYQIEVEDAANGTPVFAFTATTPNATATVSGLKPGGTYKWKVRSVCNGNTGTWSGWNTFTTPLQKPSGTTGNNGSGTPVIKIFPNPAVSGPVTLQLEDFLPGPVTVRVLDGTGAAIVVQTAEISGDLWQQSLSLPDDLLQGVYYVQVAGARKVLTVKFVK
jgi:hypothetical protein